MAREGSLLTNYCKFILFNVGKGAKKVQGNTFVNLMVFGLRHKVGSLYYSGMQATDNSDKLPGQPKTQWGTRD